MRPAPGFHSAAILLAATLLLAACGPYRPGVDGRLPTLQQNAPANSIPQPRGSLPP